MGPFDRFTEELDALIDSWLNKVEDDKLTYAEMIGAIELAKASLIQGALALADVEEEEED